MKQYLAIHSIYDYIVFKKIDFMHNEKWKSQVRKGVLEFVILLVLQRNEYYGYELIKQIKTLTSIDVSEGTIYPLLNRLKNTGLIESKWVEYETGVPRKYYSITEAGLEAVKSMKVSWMELNFSIQKLMVE